MNKTSKYIMSIVLVGIAACAWTCNAIAATATGSFTYDYTNDPPCSDTVTTNCIDHFQIFDVTASPQDVVLTTIVPSSRSPVPTGVTTVPFNFKIGAPYGTRKWAVTAIAKDKNGAFVSSDLAAPQAQATVVVKPGAPAAFTVTLQ
jgi:hypothetical protein